MIFFLFYRSLILHKKYHSSHTGCLHPRDPGVVQHLQTNKGNLSPKLTHEGKSHDHSGDVKRASDNCHHRFTVKAPKAKTNAAQLGKTQTISTKTGSKTRGSTLSTVTQDVFKILTRERK